MEGCAELAELQFFNLPPERRAEARVLAALPRWSASHFAGKVEELPQWKTFEVNLGTCEGVRCADTGELIPPELVKAGREKEVAELKAFGVFEFIRGQDALNFRWVRCRWVDRMKKGACRSRFVAMEFANSLRDDLYAGTPLLGVVRLLVSEAATHPKGKAPAKILSAADIPCAFMHASAPRSLLAIRA